MKEIQKENKDIEKGIFETKRTTSHWPYPMNVVPLQPNVYNYYNAGNEIYINYEYLPKPELDDLMEKIEVLL